jgi:hypothetical protein
MPLDTGCAAPKALGRPLLHGLCRQDFLVGLPDRMDARTRA